MFALILKKKYLLYAEKEALMRLHSHKHCNTFVPVDWHWLNEYPFIQLSNRNT